MESRLIVTEGLMGSGKSATATSIALGLQLAQVPYSYWWEGERPHPVRVEQERNGTTSSAEELIDAGLTKWAAFVQWLGKRQSVGVLDGLLFHISVTNLLKQDATLEQAAAYIDEVAAIIQPLRPTLVYFRQRDISAALARVTDKRGQKWIEHHIGYKCNTPIGRRLGLQGAQGLLTFCQMYCKWTDALFDALPVRKLMIDNSDPDWDRDTALLEQFLGLDLRTHQEGNRHLSDEVDKVETVVHLENRTTRHVAACRWPYKKSQALVDFELGPGETAQHPAALTHRYRFRDVHSGEALQDTIIWERQQRVVVADIGSDRTMAYSALA